MLAVYFGLKYEEKKAWNNFSMCRREEPIGSNCCYLFKKDWRDGLWIQQNQPFPFTQRSLESAEGPARNMCHMKPATQKIRICLLRLF